MILILFSINKLLFQMKNAKTQTYLYSIWLYLVYFLALWKYYLGFGVESHDLWRGFFPVPSTLCIKWNIEHCLDELEVLLLNHIQPLELLLNQWMCVTWDKNRKFTFLFYFCLKPRILSRHTCWIIVALPATILYWKITLSEKFQTISAIYWVLYSSIGKAKISQ